MPAPIAPAYHVTSLDRIGLALLAGGGLGGMTTAILAAAGGARSPVALGVALMIGAVCAMFGLVTLAGPIWLILHRRGRRGPRDAMVATGLPAFVVFTIAQLWGAGGGYRWASALGTSLLIAIVAAGVGAAMQRVAYRRLL